MEHPINAYQEPQKNTEVCSEQVLQKLHTWLDRQLKDNNKDIATKKSQQEETSSWIRKMTPKLTSKSDKEILRAARGQLVDMGQDIRLLENKQKVLKEENGSHEVENILTGKTKKEVVEEITAILEGNKGEEEEKGEIGEMIEVTEDKSGMVWGKPTYCNELSSWEDLFEALLFYVDRDKEEEN